MPPFLERADYREHLLVVHLIVALHVRETLGHEGYWVKLSIHLELGQNRTGREVGGVALKLEAACISGEGEDGGGGDGLLEALERTVLVWSPGPSLCLPGQSVKGAGLFREVLDEPVVEVDEA